MSRQLILAHDLGTTGNKATLYDGDGQVLAGSFYGYQTTIPRITWAEQNPEDWWQAVCVSTKHLLAAARVEPADIACVSFSGQMMGCVAEKLTPILDVTSPNPQATPVYDRLYNIFNRAYEALVPVYEALAGA